MGFGKLFHHGPDIWQQTVDKISAANQQIIANNQAQQLAANTKAQAALPQVKADITKSLEPAKPPSAALGILDFIRTTPSGLSNDNKKGGKLTVLGN